jgi:DNA-binding NarL/FixJ family response regulator
VISVVIVADSGAALQRLTETIGELPDVHIVRHCHGRGPLRPQVAARRPDLVVMDEMHWPRMTLRRIAEIDTPVVLCTSRPEARWLGDALRAGARAVVPHSAGAATLRQVMAEALAAEPVTVLRPMALAA